MGSCLSVSNIQEWMHKPIDFEEEKCRLIIFTAIVLAAIGLATLCYFYGAGIKDYPAGYHQFYAYAVWGLSGASIVGAAVAYLARAIICWKDQRAIAQAEAQQRIVNSYIFKHLFPNTTLKGLPEFSSNLLDGNYYFTDPNQVLNMDFAACPEVKIIRAQQDGRPFLAARLAIYDNPYEPTSQIILIAPGPRGGWFVSAVAPINYPAISDSIYQQLSYASIGNSNWLAILGGESRQLGSDSHAPVISLWPVSQN